MLKDDFTSYILALILFLFIIKVHQISIICMVLWKMSGEDWKVLFAEVFDCGPADMDVYNISGRLNGQEHWPTHDGHVSIDSFSIVNEGRKDLTNAPPPYTNVDLPTYDEAIQAMASQKATTAPVPIHNSSIRGPPPPEYLPNV